MTRKLYMQIKLTAKERNALYEWSKRNMREMREQVTWLVVTELMRMGYLPTNHLEEPEEEEK